MKDDPYMAKSIKCDPKMAEWYLKKQRTVVGGVLRPQWSRTWILRRVGGVSRHYQTVYTPLPPSCDFIYACICLDFERYLSQL